MISNFILAQVHAITFMLIIALALFVLIFPFEVQNKQTKCTFFKIQITQKDKKTFFFICTKMIQKFDTEEMTKAAL